MATKKRTQNDKQPSNSEVLSNRELKVMEGSSLAYRLVAYRFMYELMQNDLTDLAFEQIRLGIKHSDEIASIFLENDDDAKKSYENTLKKMQEFANSARLFILHPRGAQQTKG